MNSKGKVWYRTITKDCNYIMYAKTKVCNHVTRYSTGTLLVWYDMVHIPWQDGSRSFFSYILSWYYLKTKAMGRYHAIHTPILSSTWQCEEVPLDTNRFNSHTELNLDMISIPHRYNTVLLIWKTLVKTNMY